MASRSHCLAYFLALTLLVQSAFAAGASDTALSVLNSTDKIKAGPSVLAIAAVVVGVFMCIAGYRLFRAAIFVCGFILGGIGVASPAGRLDPGARRHHDGAAPGPPTLEPPTRGERA